MMVEMLQQNGIRRRSTSGNFCPKLTAGSAPSKLLLQVCYLKVGFTPDNNVISSPTKFAECSLRRCRSTSYPTHRISFHQVRQYKHSSHTSPTFIHSCIHLHSHIHTCTHTFTVYKQYQFTHVCISHPESSSVTLFLSSPLAIAYSKFLRKCHPQRVGSKDVSILPCLFVFIKLLHIGSRRILPFQFVFIKLLHIGSRQSFSFSICLH